jgi:ATP-dependent DNA helicase RecG
VSLIYLKYLKAAITYHKETRVETYPFAREAVREAVFNALIHCNWADNVPVQIRIEDDVMYVSNCSMLPFGWTVETLLGSHASKPYNPDIARVFYRAGYIENWGRGIQKIRDACKAHGAEEPEYIVHGGDSMVKFKALQSAIVTESKGSNEPLGEPLEQKILNYIKSNPRVTYEILAEEFSVSTSTIKRNIAKLTKSGFLERKGGKRYGYWEVVDFVE